MVKKFGKDPRLIRDVADPRLHHIGPKVLGIGEMHHHLDDSLTMLP